MKAPVALSIVVVLLVAWAYNRLVRLRSRTSAAWSQVDVQLRRRHDLIPNLLTSVQAYMAHERTLLKQIAETRAQAAALQGDIGARARLESNLEALLVMLTATSQAVPQVGADVHARMLQEELSSSERRIAFARQHYNDCVMDYNSAIASFPTNIIAGLCAFRPAILFRNEEFGAEDTIHRTTVACN